MSSALDRLVSKLGTNLHTLPWLLDWAAQTEASLQDRQRGFRASSSTRRSLDIAALRTTSPFKFGAGTNVSCVHDAGGN